ncbi:MAG: N-acetyltransferase [Actinobacteria bacterium]|nr:N-acetyltransferase [Actinomycetota bacterium]
MKPPFAGIVEKARLADAGAIQKLVNYFADRDEMLHRALSDVYENIRDFFVYREAGEVLGCGSLHVLWDDLAEIKAMAVKEERHGQGIGSLIVQACLDEAKAMAVPTVFLLTYRPTFFERFGFERVDMITLPRKVWRECYECPKFPNCEEIAMVLPLSSG